MAHTVRLSDETYKILSDIAEDEGRTIPRQIEFLVKKLALLKKQVQENNSEYQYLSSKEAYQEACKQADNNDVIHVGEYTSLENLLDKLGI